MIPSILFRFARLINFASFSASPPEIQMTICFPRSDNAFSILLNFFSHPGAVDYIGNGSHRNPGVFCNILYRCHRYALLLFLQLYTLCFSEASLSPYFPAGMATVLSAESLSACTGQQPVRPLSCHSPFPHKYRKAGETVNSLYRPPACHNGNTCYSVVFVSDYDFTAPATTPAIIYFCNARYKMMTGIIAITSAAISRSISFPYAPWNSFVAIGMVYKFLSVRIRLGSR